MKADLATWLATLPAGLAVTLRYESGPVTIDKLRSDLKVLQGMIDRKLFGRNFYRSPIRTSYWAIAESMDVNPHAHVGWHVPAPHAWQAMKLIQSGIWETIARGGTHDIQPLTSPEEWAAYAVKSMTTTDHLILSPNYNIEIPPDIVV